MKTIDNMCESSIRVKISCGKKEKHLQYVKKAVGRMKNIENMYDKDAVPPHSPPTLPQSIGKLSKPGANTPASSMPVKLSIFWPRNASDFLWH
jgi:hypothetical protein